MHLTVNNSCEFIFAAKRAHSSYNQNIILVYAKDMKLLRFINLGLFCIIEKGWTFFATNIQEVGLAKFTEAYKKFLPSSEVRIFLSAFSTN